jgi:histidyl-tRNA synthetase
MNKLKPIKGCRDLLDNDILKFRFIVEKFQDIAKLYGCQEIATPILEYTEVFTKSLGASSDVVGKEMYSFSDQGNDNITLRPEFTASIMRAVFSNNLLHKLPLKLFCYGPLFRRENPQAGRQRQFHQINAEFLGLGAPYSDAEAIKFAASILDSLNITDYTLEINSLGCNISRQNYQKALFEYFQDNINSLSEISKVRLEKNPLRILDSKETCDKILIQHAPKISHYYTNDAKERFLQVLEHLKTLGIDHKLNEQIVRGLDYYSHTAFEFTSTNLGAQSAIIAGGRYDGLAQLMQHQEQVCAIGFAGGIERMMMLINKDFALQFTVIVIPISNEQLPLALKTADLLRQNDICCSLEVGKKIGDVIKKALKNSTPKFAILIGQDEEKSGLFTLKDLENFTQESLTIQDVIRVIYEKK